MLPVAKAPAFIMQLTWFAPLDGDRQGFQKAKLQGKTLKQVGVIWK
jgi:hypothetical protein